MKSIVRAGRLLAYFMAVLVVCLYCEVVGRVWSLWLAPKGSKVQADRANRVTRHWNVALVGLTLSVLKSRLDIRGEVPSGRYVVVSNHQSTADLAILPWVLRGQNLKFVAKKELGRWIPTVSMALRHWGSALISRSRTREDILNLKAMGLSLEHWSGSAVVFPEGTRSRDGRLGPYKAAAVRIIAMESGLPILPVAIDGTHVATELPRFALRMAGAHGIVTVGNPIPPESWHGRIDEVVQEIRTWTDETIERGRRDGAIPPPAAWQAGRGDSDIAPTSPLRTV